MSAAEAYGAMPGTGAGAGATERDGLVCNLTRAEAEAALRLQPLRPILRSCSYTPRFPGVFAVSYVVPGGELIHTLVERLSDGQWRSILEVFNVVGGPRLMPSGSSWASENAMMDFFREESTRSRPSRTTAPRAPLVRASSGAHEAPCNDIAERILASLACGESNEATDHTSGVGGDTSVTIDESASTSADESRCALPSR